MTERNIISPHIKRKIWERQNEKCAYCGTRRKLANMTVDHIIPFSKGGTDEIENLQCTCKLCNHMKADMMPSEFTAFVRYILENSIRIEKSGVLT